MSLALRIITLQAGCVLAAGLVLPPLASMLGLATDFSAAVFVAVLLGGCCVVIPNALYAWITRAEHRPGRLLGFAQAKVMATVLLLAVAMAIGTPAPLWMLLGMVGAYVAHAVGALVFS